MAKRSHVSYQACLQCKSLPLAQSFTRFTIYTAETRVAGEGVRKQWHTKTHKVEHATQQRPSCDATPDANRQRAGPHLQQTRGQEAQSAADTAHQAAWMSEGSASMRFLRDVARYKTKGKCPSHPTHACTFMMPPWDLSLELWGSTCSRDRGT